MTRPMHPIERFARIVALSLAVLTALGHLQGSGLANGTTAGQAAKPAAQGGVRTDRAVYREPSPPPLPPAGGTLVDPTFGATILRVTDAADGSDNKTAYSYWPSFNRDSTRLFVISGNGSLVVSLDPVSFKISNKRRAFLSPAPSEGTPFSEDAIWSGSDPDLVYCHTDLKLWAYNVATNRYSLVKDFARELSAGDLLQMSKSSDDNIFAFTRRDANAKKIGYVVWRRDQDSIHRVETGAGMDEVQLDKSGRYLVLKTGNSGAGAIRVKAVDLRTKKEENLTDGAPDYAPGHSDNGNGIVAGYDNWTNRITVRRLASPHQFRSAIDFGNDWSLSNHVSMLADGDEWLLLSTYVSNTLPSTGVFRNELLLVATDGSKRVRRLAHHHSVLREYWDSPRANISRDGRFVAFTSNWGARDRRDIFILKVPEGDAAATERGQGTPSNLSQPVRWATVINCARSARGLVKISGSDGAADASARSEQLIESGDGYVEFAAAETDKTRWCGVARGAAGAEVSLIDFAIKLTGGGMAEVRESGDYAGEVSYRSGDVFRIAVESGAVKYYKNGSIFFTSLRPAVYPLRVAVTLISLGSTLDKVVVGPSP